MNGSGFLDLPAVMVHSLFQRGGGRTRRRQQRFDELPGLNGIQLSLLALSNHLAGNFTGVRNDELSQRATLDGCSFTEKFFVRHGHPGNESLTFRFFQCRTHAPIV